MAEGTTIGQSVTIKGDLTANEDLTIEGQVEGKVQLDQHTVTVGADGRVTAELQAKVVNVQGKTTGNITASEKITLHEGSTVQGDLTAPKVAIAEGALFKGKIDMQSGKSQPDNQPRSQPGTATARK